MGDVRSKLREDATEDYELLKTALKDGLDADKPVQRKCEHCGRSNTFLIPDHASRMKAVDLWISQGFGKPPQEPQDDQEFDLGADVWSMDSETLGRFRAWVRRNYSDAATSFDDGWAKEQKRQQSDPARTATMAVPRKRPR